VTRLLARAVGFDIECHQASAQTTSDRKYKCTFGCY
jgi:hypothetical protein